MSDDKPATTWAEDTCPKCGKNEWKGNPPVICTACGYDHTPTGSETAEEIARATVHRLVGKEVDWYDADDWRIVTGCVEAGLAARGVRLPPGRRTRGGGVVKDPDRLVKHEREDRECELLNEIARLERECENQRILSNAADKDRDNWKQRALNAEHNFTVENGRAEQAEARVKELEPVVERVRKVFKYNLLLIQRDDTAPYYIVPEFIVNDVRQALAGDGEKTTTGTAKECEPEDKTGDSN